MFKEQLIEAFKDGLLLLVKYGLILFIIIYTVMLVNQTRQMAINGNLAAGALNQFIEKGYLPALVNGIVPDRNENTDK